MALSRLIYDREFDADITVDDEYQNDRNKVNYE